LEEQKIRKVKLNIFTAVCILMMTLAVLVGAVIYYFLPGRRIQTANAAASRKDIFKQASIPTEAMPLTIEALKKEAIDIAVQLTKDFPGDVRAIFLLGDIYKSLGSSAKAAECWEKCLEINPNYADAYHNLGRIAFQKAKYEKAVELWRKAVGINPELPGIYNSLGSALMCLGKTREAVKAFQKDIEISGQSIHSQFMLGEQYQLLEEYENAKKCYETVIKIKPDYTSAYHGLATVCERLGENDKSRDFMEKFKKLKLLEMKALKERDSAFNDLVSVRQTVAEAHTDVGRLYYSRRNPAKAEKLLQRAAALDPKQSKCRVLLASMYEQGQRLAEALECYKQISHIKPDNVNCHGNIGVISFQLKRYYDADKAFRKVIELEPNNSFGYRYLAYLYLSTEKQIPEARKLAEKAVTLEKTGENYFIFAWDCNMTGDQARARWAIKRAIELEPGNKVYKQMYEQMKRGD
jgi:tetratricopeptide (TPR) repeat protein